MSMILHTEELLQLLTQELEIVEKEKAKTIINRAQRSVLICKDFLRKLEKYIEKYSFTTQQEEIHFFKEIKPKFYSLLIYYRQLFNIEIARPVGSFGDLKAYAQKELDKIKEFFNDNKFFYQYFRSKETYLDEKLFLRNHPLVALPLQLLDGNSNPLFSTNHDYINSRILANELLLEYLNKSISELTGEIVPEKKDPTKQQKPLTWTLPKAFLIELAYALKESKALNNGTATLKEIIDTLQISFNIEITNPSRTFQEILSRKGGRTTFLDLLKDAYLNYIDTIEEKTKR